MNQLYVPMSENPGCHKSPLIATPYMYRLLAGSVYLHIAAWILKLKPLRKHMYIGACQHRSFNYMVFIFQMWFSSVHSRHNILYFIQITLGFVTNGQFYVVSVYRTLMIYLMILCGPGCKRLPAWMTDMVDFIWRHQVTLCEQCNANTSNDNKVQV